MTIDTSIGLDDAERAREQQPNQQTDKQRARRDDAQPTEDPLDTSDTVHPNEGRPHPGPLP